jgi:hypothetical protein
MRCMCSEVAANPNRLVGESLSSNAVVTSPLAINLQKGHMADQGKTGMCEILIRTRTPVFHQRPCPPGGVVGGGGTVRRSAES